MISKHCGVRLQRLTRDSDAVQAHVWRCPVCKRSFAQAVRKPKAK